MLFHLIRKLTKRKKKLWRQQVYTEFGSFLWHAPKTSLCKWNWDGRKRLFVFFIFTKTQCFAFIVYTSKSKPFTVSNDVLIFLVCMIINILVIMQTPYTHNISLLTWHHSLFTIKIKWSTKHIKKSIFIVRSTVCAFQRDHRPTVVQSLVYNK